MVEIYIYHNFDGGGVILLGCDCFVAKVFFFFNKMDYDGVLVVVLMMRSLWVIFVFFFFPFFAHDDLIFGSITAAAYSRRFKVVFALARGFILVIQFWVVFELVLFPLPFHLSYRFIF